jgi:hypothetical protein
MLPENMVYLEWQKQPSVRLYHGQGNNGCMATSKQRQQSNKLTRIRERGQRREKRERKARKKQREGTQREREREMR